MIPYDDLVNALAAWRVRKGLPVATTGSTAPAPAPAAKAGSRARSTPPAAPPAAPQPAAQRAQSPAPRAPSPQAQTPRAPTAEHRKQISVPPPLAAPEVDLDEAMLDENAYENEGDDFAMQFAAEDGATAVGQPPTRDSVATDPVGAPAAAKRHRNDEDW